MSAIGRCPYGGAWTWPDTSRCCSPWRLVIGTPMRDAMCLSSPWGKKGRNMSVWFCLDGWVKRQFCWFTTHGSCFSLCLAVTTSRHSTGKQTCIGLYWLFILSLSWLKHVSWVKTRCLRNPHVQWLQGQHWQQGQLGRCGRRQGAGLGRLWVLNKFNSHSSNNQLVGGFNHLEKY